MTLPAMLIAMLVAMMATALTLDRIWLSAAQAELTTAAESAALRGGRLLANDDLLRLRVDHKERLRRVREAAAQIAATNKIAGEQVQLDDSEEGDIRFGRIVKQRDDRNELFVETSYNPNCVVVRAEHSRSMNNPVGLFMGVLTGQPEGDVAAIAEASIDNQIVAFRPFDGVPVPVLPMAILRFDSKRCGRPAWETEIEQRQGSDRLKFDESTKKVVRGADGIPEIVLRSPAFGAKPEDANLHFFALNPTSSRDAIARQIQTGWSEQDFPKQYKGLFRIDRPQHDWRTVNVGSGVVNELNKLIGQCRIVFLFDEFQAGQNGEGTIRCVGIVAGRILALQHQRDGSCEFIFQPGVLTTRTAVIAKEMPIDGPCERFENKYIYKLQLTN